MATTFNLDKLGELARPIPKEKLCASVTIGAVIGAISSIVCNACMLEITLNGFFTIVFFFKKMANLSTLLLYSS